MGLREREEGKRREKRNEGNGVKGMRWEECGRESERGKGRRGKGKREGSGEGEK